MDMKPTGKSRLKPLLASIAMVVVGLVMIFAAWKLTHGPLPPPPPPPVEYGPKRKAFFEKEIAPLIAAEDDGNRVAIARAEARLDEVFASYRRHVPEFADALTQWGTKFQITKAMVKDKFKGTDEAGKIPTQLFADKVVSDQKLTADIANIVNGLKADFDANRDVMLSEATNRLTTADFPVPGLNTPNSQLRTAFNEELKTILEKRGWQLPIVTALSFAGSGLTTWGVERIVQQVITMLAAQMAAEAGEAGGATAVGGVGGGAAGTAAEPGGGTAIGIVAGLVVGAVVDVWMERGFKEKITAECNQFLEKMHSTVWSDSKEGLQFRFNEAVESVRDCHAATLQKIITG